MEEISSWWQVNRLLDNPNIVLELDTIDGDDYDMWGVDVKIKRIDEGYRISARGDRQINKTVSTKPAVIREMKSLDPDLSQWRFDDNAVSDPMRPECPDCGARMLTDWMQELEGDTQYETWCPECELAYTWWDNMLYESEDIQCLS